MTRLLMTRETNKPELAEDTLSQDQISFEASLRESEACYRALVEASPSAIVAVRDDRFIYVNPAAARLLGFPGHDGLVGRAILDVVAPNSRELIEEQLRALTEGKCYPRAQFELLRQDGSMVFVEGTFASVELPDGPAALIIAQDISQRRRDEHRMRMMEFSIEHALDRIGWYALDGRFLYANKATYEEMGYSLEEILSMTVSDYDPSCTPEAFAGYYEALKEVGHMRLETQHISKDGQLHDMEVSANLLVFEDTAFIVSFGREITERKQAENALRRNHEEAQRLASRLLSAHEDERRRIGRELHDDLAQE